MDVRRLEVTINVDPVGIQDAARKMNAAGESARRIAEGIAGQVPSFAAVRDDLVNTTGWTDIPEVNEIIHAMEDKAAAISKDVSGIIQQRIDKDATTVSQFGREVESNDSSDGEKLLSTMRVYYGKP